MKYVRLISMPLLAMLLFCIPVMAIAQNTTSQDPAPESGLEGLVGPIALYPDDLLSIILPASTFPLQIVEADRWLQENEGKTDAQPKSSWDDSVKALINYPEVISMMSNDLEWTSAMGEAVVTDQTDVMDAVQSFRRKAEGAGNLQSDGKQTVVVEEEVVKIVQAEPDVIYVPQYEPTVVIVEQQVPVYPTYYPNPYPVYYYPYPPGHAFMAGVFWGATVAWAFDWWGGGIHNDVNIDIDIDRDVDRNRDVDRDRSADARSTNIDRGESQRMSSESRSSWQSKQNPSDVRQGRSSPSASTRTGQSTQRPQASTGRTKPSGSSASSRSQSSKTNYQSANRSASSARTSPPSSNAISGMSSSRSASAYSSRGASSRGMRGGGGRRR